MHSLNIQLTDNAYAALAAVAQSDGRSVEAVAADQLQADFTDELPASFWTPERMAELDAAAADIAAGNFFTAEQVREHFARKSEAWTQSQP